MAENTPTTPILELHKLCRYFGGLKAVHEVDLVLQPHALNGLIGPNGSGKTTIFNVIPISSTKWESPVPSKTSAFSPT